MIQHIQFFDSPILVLEPASLLELLNPTWITDSSWSLQLPDLLKCILLKRSYFWDFIHALLEEQVIQGSDLQLGVLVGVTSALMTVELLVTGMGCQQVLHLLPDVHRFSCAGWRHRDGLLAHLRWKLKLRLRLRRWLTRTWIKLRTSQDLDLGYLLLWPCLLQLTMLVAVTTVWHW